MKIYKQSPQIVPAYSIPMRASNSPMTLKIPRTLYLVIAVLVVGVALTMLNVWELRRLQTEHFVNKHTPLLASVEADNSYASGRPVVWVKAANPDSGYLDHVFKVFHRAGFVRGSRESKWDVLWLHDYPFLNEELKPVLNNLEAHQKVNHIPGSGYYTSKVNLATSNISGIPHAFKLPEERSALIQAATLNPDHFWVQKSNRHRGIVIKKINELDLNQEDSFVQQYISNPLLVDGRKFDIGVYTVITSVRPLRVYVLDSEALLRFCPEDYHPFDVRNVNKYVVGDEYTPTWNIKSLARFYSELGMTHKESLNAFLTENGKDASLIWTRIRQTIREVLMSKLPQFRALIDSYKNNGRNFFELSRFDFVVDENLEVFLMEANMSPNLSSSHFPANKLVYEQVLYNLLNVVGIARHLHTESLRERAVDEEQMRVSDKDLHVYTAECLSSDCGACVEPKCMLCKKCMSAEQRRFLRDAYLEHVNRRGTRRVLPAPLADGGAAESEEQFKRAIIDRCFFDEDKLLAWWFRGKCLQDRTWCQ